MCSVIVPRLSHYFSVSVDKICEMVSVGLSHSEQKLAAHHFDTIEKALTKKEVHH